VKAEERRVEMAEFIAAVRAEEALEEEADYWRTHTIARYVVCWCYISVVCLQRWSHDIYAGHTTNLFLEFKYMYVYIYIFAHRVFFVCCAQVEEKYEKLFPSWEA
jgi:hypothetical protein